MKKPLLSVLVVGVLLGAGSGWADEQPDAKVLLDKAIQAMGGRAKLAKLATGSMKARITGGPGGQEIAVDIDGTWRGMSQYRANVEVQQGGNNFKGVLVFTVAQGWIKKGDDTKDAPEGVAPFIQNIFYAGRMPQLLPALRDKAYKLTPLGEVQVGQKGAGRTAFFQLRGQVKGDRTGAACALGGDDANDPALLRNQLRDNLRELFQHRAELIRGERLREKILGANPQGLQN